MSDCRCHTSKGLILLPQRNFAIFIHLFWDTICSFNGYGLIGIQIIKAYSRTQYRTEGYPLSPKSLIKLLIIYFDTKVT